MNELPPVAEVVALARVAGEAILQVYATDFDTRSKADGSPVTRADTEADRILRDGLQRIAPGIPVVSEESDVPPYRERACWPRCWLVDPLDGTREFVRRSGEFVVNVALVEGGRAVLGVVLAPVDGACWHAVAGRGAWRSEAGGAPRRIGTRDRPPDTTAVIASRARRNRWTDAFIEHMGPHTLTRMGSALKTCLVAEGRADVYPCFSATSEWDTAAPQCILEEAGGGVLDLAMRALTYNRESLDNPLFLAVGDPQVDWSAYLPPELRDG